MRWSDWHKGLAIILVAFFLLGGAIFVSRLVLAESFSKEEAQHAIYGLWIYKDIRALDWQAFWYDTQRQMFWPFLHSWFQAGFFLLFGVSYFSARLLSFIFFSATLFLMYYVANQISFKNGWKIGSLAVLLAFLSPQMVKFATANTLEGMGALIFLASFSLYAYCEQRKLTIDYVLLAVLVGLSIYTNYLYAYLIIPAFIVMTLGKLGPMFIEVHEYSHQGEKAAYHFYWWAYRKLIFLGVLLLVAAAWFMTSTFSRKIMLFFQAIFRLAGGEVISGWWSSFLYYPWVIINHYSFSPWLGILLVAALLLPFTALRNRVFGKLYTFVWVVILLLTLTVPTKAPQFLYIIAPFIYLIFSSAVFYFMERSEMIKRATIGILAVAGLVSLFYLPNLWRAYFPYPPGQKMIHVLDYYKNRLLPRFPVASSLNLQRLNAEGIAFHFWDWNAPVIADPIIGEEEMFRAAKYFLSVEPDPAPPYQLEVLDDSLHRWNTFIREKQAAGELVEYSQQRFHGLGLTAKIYEKISR